MEEFVEGFLQVSGGILRGFSGDIIRGNLGKLPRKILVEEYLEGFFEEFLAEVLVQYLEI